MSLQVRSAGARAPARPCHRQ